MCCFAFQLSDQYSVLYVAAGTTDLPVVFVCWAAFMLAVDVCLANL